MKKLYTFLLCMALWSVTAQDIQNSNWALFDGGGLTFPGVNQAPLTFSSSLTSGNSLASASVSDEDGMLLFYTDGNSVFNANGTVMTNGIGLLGTFGDFTQNVVIIPNPADINRFYIFYISPGQFINGTLNGLLFSEVAMNNGLGTVNASTRNTSLLPAGRYGKITSAAHTNGVDYWLIVDVENQIRAYQITAAGVQPPVISASPLPAGMYKTANALAIGSGNGPMKTSPDCTRLMIGYSEVNATAPAPMSRLYVGDFNAGNGVAGNFALTSTPVGTDQMQLTGAEFSPNGNIVHRTYSGVVVSSELFNPVMVVLPGTQQSVPQWQDREMELDEVSEDSRNFQRSLDGRIYFEDNNQPNVSLMGVIDHPDSPPYDIQYSAVNINPVNTTALNNNIPTWVHWQCQPTLTSTGNHIGQRNRQRSEWIESTDIFSGANARGIYHAGRYVDMRPGFDTANNAGFIAYIEGCTGTFAYRMAQNDKAEAEFRAVSAESSRLVVFPNPSDSRITILKPGSQLKSLHIMSMEGKCVFKAGEATQSYEVDVSSFARGVYFVNIQTSSGESLTSKFIKN